MVIKFIEVLGLVVCILGGCAWLYYQFQTSKGDTVK